jgi:hypothetical protein
MFIALCENHMNTLKNKIDIPWPWGLKTYIQNSRNNFSLVHTQIVTYSYISLILDFYEETLQPIYNISTIILCYTLDNFQSDANEMQTETLVNYVTGQNFLCFYRRKNTSILQNIATGNPALPGPLRTQVVRTVRFRWPS